MRAATPTTAPPQNVPAAQVLGLPTNADYNAIQRAYKKRMSEVKGRDEAEQARIEAAHSRLMLSALTSRLQVRRVGRGGGGAPSELRGGGRGLARRLGRSEQPQAPERGGVRATRSRLPPATHTT